MQISLLFVVIIWVRVRPYCATTCKLKRKKKNTISYRTAAIVSCYVNLDV